MKLIPLLLATLILSIVPSLTSCSSMNASSTESMLSAAGFRVKTPANAKQREIYNQLPEYKIQRGEYQGKIFYAYKDVKQGVAYVGGEKEYQAYQQIATQRSIATAQLSAASMNQAAAQNFYGYWGPVYY